MTLHCTSMWWPRNSLGGKLNSLVFLSLSGLTIYNFLSSVYHGPGYVPLGWKPVRKNTISLYIPEGVIYLIFQDKSEECEYLQYCGVCKGYKAPRSHHCRKCK